MERERKIKRANNLVTKLSEELKMAKEMTIVPTRKNLEREERERKREEEIEIEDIEEMEKEIQKKVEDEIKKEKKKSGKKEKKKSGKKAPTQQLVEYIFKQLPTVRNINVTDSNFILTSMNEITYWIQNIKQFISNFFLEDGIFLDNNELDDTYQDVKERVGKKLNAFITETIEAINPVVNIDDDMSVKIYDTDRLVENYDKITQKIDSILKKYPEMKSDELDEFIKSIMIYNLKVKVNKTKTKYLVPIGKFFIKPLLYFKYDKDNSTIKGGKIIKRISRGIRKYAPRVIRAIPEVLRTTRDVVDTAYKIKQLMSPIPGGKLHKKKVKFSSRM